MILGQSSLRGFSGKGEGRESGGRWEITAEFICQGREVGPTGLWDYWLPGICSAQGRTVFSWQSTPPAHSSSTDGGFLTHPACVRAAGLGFRMNHLLSQPKQEHFVGMQNKPLRTQSIWSPLLNVLSEKAAIPYAAVYVSRALNFWKFKNIQVVK